MDKVTSLNSSAVTTERWINTITVRIWMRERERVLFWRSGRIKLFTELWASCSGPGRWSTTAECRRKSCRMTFGRCGPVCKGDTTPVSGSSGWWNRASSRSSGRRASRSHWEGGGNWQVVWAMQSRWRQWMSEAARMPCSRRRPWLLELPRRVGRP